MSLLRVFETRASSIAREMLLQSKLRFSDNLSSQLLVSKISGMRESQQAWLGAMFLLFVIFQLLRHGLEARSLVCGFLYQCFRRPRTVAAVNQDIGITLWRKSDIGGMFVEATCSQPLFASLFCVILVVTRQLHVRRYCALGHFSSWSQVLTMHDHKGSTVLLTWQAFPCWRELTMFWCQLLHFSLSFFATVSQLLAFYAVAVDYVCQAWYCSKLPGVAPWG